MLRVCATSGLPSPDLLPTGMRRGDLARIRAQRSRDRADEKCLAAAEIADQMHGRVGGKHARDLASRRGIGLFLQCVGVFTLSGAGAQTGGEFRHRFFRSLFLRLGRGLICTSCRTGFRTGFRTGLSTSLGPYDWIYDLLCARNKNPRKGSLLVGGFVLLVVVIDVAIGNITGIFLQRTAQFS